MECINDVFDDEDEDDDEDDEGEQMRKWLAGRVAKILVWAKVAAVAAPLAIGH